MTHGTVLKSTCGCWPAMRSATATPSSSALCASIGPRTTSPIAQTSGRLVRQSPSTATKPRSSSFSPIAVGVQAVGVRHAADRDDQLVADQLLLGPGGVGVGDRHALAARLDLADLDAEFDLQPLLDEGLLRFAGDLFVDHAEKGRQRLEHRDIGAEPAPDRAHLEADHAGADHAQGLRHRGDRERTGRSTGCSLRRTRRRAARAGSTRSRR